MYVCISIYIYIKLCMYIYIYIYIILLGELTDPFVDLRRPRPRSEALSRKLGLIL